jgi:large subunit ribosomal protein L31
MNKDIHPKSHLATFKCACGGEFKISTTVKADLIPIDICSNCHPLYKHGANEQTIKGRAEKLASRFNVDALNKKNKQ